jgi:glutamate/tyrosine decarboxylase-like PLP-dependent enzyme
VFYLSINYLQACHINFVAFFDSKAAEYFQMKIVKIPVNEKKRSVNIKEMRKAITRNTVMVLA